MIVGLVMHQHATRAVLLLFVSKYGHVPFSYLLKHVILDLALINLYHSFHYMKLFFLRFNIFNIQ